MKTTINIIFVFCFILLTQFAVAQQWVESTLPGASSLYTGPSYFVNSNTGYVSGEDGIILKTTNGGVITEVQNTGIELPGTYNLYQNYPNPFNPSTSIKFKVKSLKFVQLKVYDITGRELATLVNESLRPGEYEVQFDGAGFSSGVYFYRLVVGDPGSSPGQGYVETKRMVLVK